MPQEKFRIRRKGSRTWSGDQSAILRRIRRNAAQFRDRLAHPPRHPEENPQKDVTLVRLSQISPESRKKPQIPLDNASYKLYYVNYEIGLSPRPFQTPARSHSSPLSYFLSAVFPDFCWASS